MALIDDIIAALATAGLGQTTSDTADWRLRGAYLQQGPDRSICVYAAGGKAPEPGQPVTYPSIQIRVRGAPNDYAAVAAKEEAIFQFMQSGNAPAQFGAGYVYCYAQQSAPMPLGQDENRRPSVVRNYRLMAAS